MTKAPPYRLTSVSLAILSLTLMVFAVINFLQRIRYRLPDDGVSWVDSKRGVEAWIVTPDGPGDRAGIREGDLLESIDRKAIQTAADAARQIFHDDVWSQANYTLVRNGEKFQTLLVLVPQKAAATVRYYLSLVGLIYLVVGTYILLRRWTAPKSLHFYIFCLASFILYTFAYTGKLNLFDWTVYWLEVLALLLQPALFLHFCLGFPEQKTFLRGRRYVIPSLYIPAAVLAAVHVLVATELMVLPMPLLQVRWLHDRVEFVYLAVYFLVGAVVLQHAYSGTQVPLLKQQLKWVTRGTWLAITLCSLLCDSLFPRVYSQRLDESLCTFPGFSPRHFWIRHRALPPDGRGRYFPPGDRLYVGHSRHRGALFQCDRVICGFVPLQNPDDQPEWLGFGRRRHRLGLPTHGELDPSAAGPIL